MTTDNERFGMRFGSGSFVEQAFENGLFEESVPPEKRALALGWASGCPIPVQLINSDESGRGPEAMEKRYGEVAFWYKYILDEAGVRNPNLYRKMEGAFPRYPNEKPVKYEPESVPPSYQTEMSRMGTLWGYAIPRVLIEQFKGTGQDPDDIQAAQDRMVRGLNILEKAIGTASTPADLLVNLAEQVAQADADPHKVLHHVLSQGKFEEENSRYMWDHVADLMSIQAPNLWQAYTQLSADEKQDLDIYNLNNSFQST